MITLHNLYPHRVYIRLETGIHKNNAEGGDGPCLVEGGLIPSKK